MNDEQVTFTLVVWSMYVFVELLNLIGSLSILRIVTMSIDGMIEGADRTARIGTYTR